MIRKLKLTNFKAFSDLDIDLKPITVLVGPNNSGKSSIIQSILLLKQTVESQDDESPIILTGDHPYYKFGTYKDIIHLNDLNKKLNISFTFDYVHRKEKREAAVPIPQVTINLSLSYRKGIKKIVRDKYEVVLDSQLFYRNIRKEEKQYVDYWGDELTSREKRIMSNLIYQDNFLDIPFSGEYYDRKRLEEILGSEKVQKLINKLYDCYSEMDRLLRNCNYIGPLRVYPERTYTYSGESKKLIGRQGENAVETIALDEARRGKYKNKIRERINYWLEKMGLAKQIEIEPIAEMFYKAKIKNRYSNESENIYDVGFGNSQIIPILVNGLITRPNQLFTVEQPEIHLHPKAQAELGDFFVMLAKNNRNVLLETHSEYLILRIQNNIAENNIKAEDVVFYYISSSEEGKSIKKMELNEKGIFANDWPGGFFPERFDETKRLASIKTNE